MRNELSAELRWSFRWS